MSINYQNKLIDFRNYFDYGQYLNGVFDLSRASEVDPWIT